MGRRKRVGGLVLAGLATIGISRTAEAANEPACTADTVRVLYEPVDQKFLVQQQTVTTNDDGSTTKTWRPCSTRWLGSGTDRTVEAWVLGPCVGWDADFDEERRLSRFATDLQTLIRQIPQLAAEAVTECRLEGKTLVQRRSTVTVTFEKGQTSKAIEFTVGPKERWSLSANGVLNKIEQAQLNEAGDALTLSEKPPKALLGLDYSFVDLATTDSRGWILKAFLEASDRPGNTLGVGASYRGRVSLGPLGSLNLTAVSPFVGAVWVREDEIDADGTVRRDTWSDADFAFGLAFNLEKLGEWLASDDGGDGE